MNNTALDVAIGLIMMYLVLSLFCTVINEYIAAFLQLRAKTLKQSIVKLLDVPSLLADFYDHGLIDGSRSASRDRHMSYLSSQNFAMALLDSLDSKKAMPQFADIEHAVCHLPDSNIRDALLTQIMQSNQDMKKLRDNVAAWYDHMMDHVTGIYKSKLRLVSFIVAVIIAVIVNADTLNVSKSLWHDRAIREQVDGYAQIISASGEPAAAADEVKKLEEELRPLPLGWNPAQLQPVSDYGFWLTKCVGLLLTALALSLGAPFWFDILVKFTNIRAAGKKPE
ncbi:MAG TPA: hypothetical protein VFT64_00095 [Rickettsiales bacterium]|nr:hypothetical protein [Rickettsiales bacterium]